MKEKLRKTIALVIGFAILLSGTTLSGEVFARETNQTLPNVSKEVFDYLDEKWDEIIFVAKDFAENGNYQIGDETELAIADPYIYYLPGRDIQDEVYYFPVYDNKTGEILFNVNVAGLGDKYTHGLSSDLAYALNEADYLSVPCVIYTYGGGVYVENANGKICGGDSSKDSMPSREETAFRNLAFSDKAMLMLERAANLKKAMPIVWESEDENLNAIMMALLTLRTPMGQYGYNMCWASTVATIANYLRYPTIITGYDVCNRLSIGYNSGGNAYNIQDGLWIYGIDYTLRSRYLTWNELTSNIDSAYPIAAGGFPSGSSIGHSVTIYGYTGSSGSSSNVNIWDSALSNGNGNYSTFTYNSGAFVSNGTTYFWENTASKS